MIFYKINNFYETVKKVQEAQQTNARILLLRYDMNQGCGAQKVPDTNGPGQCCGCGYRCGWRRADSSPEDRENLCAPVAEGGTDYAKGNRLCHVDGRKTIPRFRFIGNFISSFLTKIASGYRSIDDCRTGRTAISKRAPQADYTGNFNSETE